MQIAGDKVRVSIQFVAPGRDAESGLEAWVVLTDGTRRTDLGKVDFVDLPVGREVKIGYTLVSREAWHTDNILVYANRW
jgi:hypothetical protein